VTCIDSDQQSLSMTYANVTLNACVSADGGHFEHIM